MHIESHQSKDENPEHEEEPGKNPPGESVSEAPLPSSEQAPPPFPPLFAPKPSSGADEPAVFPNGFWQRVDYLLHHPAEVLESLRLDRDLWRFSRIFLVISLAMAAIYGAVMGATNLLQESHMATSGKVLMIAVSAIKVPVLFLLTLFIVLPPIYVSNAFVGERYSFRQMVAFLTAACAVSTTVLASMATVAFFFSLTSTGYHFIKLLHVVFFAYAGLTGISYLVRCFDTLAKRAGRRARRNILLVWLLLYMFVGTQLAWVLRPFVANPDEQFQLFRPRHGNFYESVLDSLGEVLKD